MIKRVVVAPFLCLLAQIAAAQTVQIRSGEHDSFTRLVMTLPARTQVRSEPRAHGVSLIFAAPGLVFDTTQVFERITRTRLSDITSSTGEARLDLSFACDCGLNTFWNDRNMLVIDIMADPEQNRTGTQRPRPRPLSLSGSGIEHADVRNHASPASKLLAPPLDAGFLHAPDPFGTPSRPGDPYRPFAPKDIDLAEMQSTLTRQLGDAASRGFLTPNPRRRPGPDRPKGVATTSPSETQRARTEMPPAPNRPRHHNIRVRSAFLDENASQIRTVLESNKDEVCVPDNWIDIVAWGQETPFETQVGPLIGDLLGEFDVISQNKAIRLAQLYLYFGLGLEARQILSLVNQDNRQAEVMNELAQILDEGQAENGSLLRTQIDCDTPAALWSLLSHDRLPDDLIFDHQLIQRSFVALPDHLRKHLGPILARRLIAAGHRVTADGILRAIDRSNQATPPATTLALAELAQNKGQTEIAEAGFQAAIDSNTATSAEATIELIEQWLATGQPVPFDRAELAGAFAQEHRGTSLGRRMALTYVEALAASGAFEQAFSEYDRIRPDLPKEDEVILGNRLVKHLTATASDLDFLRYTLSARAGRSQNLAPEVALSVSQRLLEAGFAEAAETYLKEPESGPDGRKQRLLRADIALALNRPRQATVAVQNIEGADAESRRGKAQSLSGEYDSAFEHFAAAGDSTAMHDAAWMAADWSKMQEAEDQVLREVADLMLSTDPSSSQSEPGMLTATRLLLDESMHARQTFGRLLDEMQMPEIPEG